MLKLENVTKSFGGLKAVDGVSLELGEVPVTGLVGPNGSGKTTLFHLITGFYRTDWGKIYFRDRRISGLPPHLISRMGLVRTFQQVRMLPSMRVLETLLCAPPRQTGENLSSVFFHPFRVREQEKRIRKAAESVLDLLKLSPLAYERSANLSFGQQKLLELGRVLMTQPELILLDEPTAGINPSLIRELVEVIRKLSARGIQIFLIEHNMPLVAEICQRVLVMDSGNLIFAGSPLEAREDPRVVEAYLGRLDHAP